MLFVWINSVEIRFYNDLMLFELKCKENCSFFWDYNGRTGQKMAAELVNSATSEKLTEMEWTQNIEICELVAHDQRCFSFCALTMKNCNLKEQ